MNGEPKKEYDFGSELDELDDTANWTPNTEANDPEPKPDMDKMRQIAEDQGFTSREPKSAPVKEPEGQITIRGKARVMDDFRDFSASQEPKWPLGYTLERALAALKRELEGQGG